jgi:cysteine-rich repeat protein
MSRSAKTIFLLMMVLIAGGFAVNASILRASGDFSLVRGVGRDRDFYLAANNTLQQEHLLSWTFLRVLSDAPVLFEPVVRDERTSHQMVIIAREETRYDVRKGSRVDGHVSLPEKQRVMDERQINGVDSVYPEPTPRGFSRKETPTLVNGRDSAPTVDRNQGDATGLSEPTVGWRAMDGVDQAPLDLVMLALDSAEEVDVPNLMDDAVGGDDPDGLIETLFSTGRPVSPEKNILIPGQTSKNLPGNPVEQEARNYAPGRIIVGFKTEGPYALEENAQMLMEKNIPFASGLAGRSSSLDRLNRLAKVTKVRPVFMERAGLRTSEAKILQQIQIQNIQQKFPERMARARTRSQGDDLPNVPDVSNIFVLEIDENFDPEIVSQAYARDPHVEFAHPDYRVSVSVFPESDPNDSFFEFLWGLKNVGQSLFVGEPGGTPGADIDATLAWRESLGDGIVVAVNDTGVDYTHGDLQGQLWVNPGEISGNGIDDDGNGFVDDVHGWNFVDNDNNPIDGHGHGTHVAGTIAAIGNNSIGVIGVAPEAKIMILRGLDENGSGTMSDLANGIVYAADNGADVVNNSWGCTSPCPSVPVVELAVDYAWGLGTIVVMAAGNENQNVSNYSPQNMEAPIVVGCTDHNDAKCDFSNFGSTVDLSAPGYDIWSTEIDFDPNWCTGFGSPSYQYCLRSGTSMSAPHVSGAAALVLSRHPLEFLTNVQIEAILKKTADDVGLVNMGTGRLNAAQALDLSNVSPVVSAGSDWTVEDGEVLTFTVTAVDPSAEIVNMFAEVSGGDPVWTIGANFTDNGNNTGNFSWTPLSEQVGLDPLIVFSAENSDGFIGQDSVQITVIHSEECGDGVVNPGEECDDGNTVSGDGCSAMCVIEFCGDGIVHPGLGEECDDGNIISGDGCSSVCVDEFCGDGVFQPGLGEQCDDGNNESGDGCDEICLLENCGDGILDPGEECDDGNNEPGDGCSAACMFEECGNGILDPGEECDDGNTDSGDGCDAMCVEEFCGDGILQPGLGEQCDDGNNEPGDGCSAVCVLEECGNGILDPGEECDDGDTDSGDGCDAMCVVEFCGDGILHPGLGEQCDDGNNTPGDGCSAGCVLEECGNGILDPGEECDDGDTDSGDGCGPTCAVEFCGDGILQPGLGEQCDDGNAVSGDGCSAMCVLEFCGDGILQPGLGEECDDGNLIDGDGCSSECLIVSICGNNICEANETCATCWQDCGSCRGGSRLPRSLM